jgi:hypothetical protein
LSPITQWRSLPGTILCLVVALDKDVGDANRIIAAAALAALAVMMQCAFRFRFARRHFTGAVARAGNCIRTANGPLQPLALQQLHRAHNMDLECDSTPEGTSFYCDSFSQLGSQRHHGSIQYRLEKIGRRGRAPIVGVKMGLDYFQTALFKQ